jgi:hypothetical protein
MSKRPKHGFWDYVKSPSLWHKETREVSQADSAPRPLSRHLPDLSRTWDGDR